MSTILSDPSPLLMVTHDFVEELQLHDVFTFLSIREYQLSDLQSSRWVITGLVTYQGGALIHLKATPCCERTSNKLISNYRRWFRVVRRFSQALLFFHTTSPAERRTFKTNNHKHVIIDNWPPWLDWCFVTSYLSIRHETCKYSRKVPKRGDF